MDRLLPLETARKAARAALDARGGGTLGRRLPAAGAVVLTAELAHPATPVALRCTAPGTRRTVERLVGHAAALPALLLAPLGEPFTDAHGCVTVWPAPTPAGVAAPPDPAAPEAGNPACWTALAGLAGTLHGTPAWPRPGLELGDGVAERAERLAERARTARAQRAVELAARCLPRFDARYFDAADREPLAPCHGDLEPANLAASPAGLRLWGLERAGMNPAVGDLARLFEHHARGLVPDAAVLAALDAYRAAAPPTIVAGDSAEALWARVAPFGALQLLRSALRLALTAADFDEYDQLDAALDALARLAPPR